MKKGFAIVAVLVIVAAVVVFSGVLQGIWLAPQISPTTQQLLSPTQPVNKFPFTTVGNLKDKKVQLAALEASIGIVRDELDNKQAQGEAGFNKIIGTTENPGILGLGLFALLGSVGTQIYNKAKMYSVDEVKQIKAGETVL